MRRSMWHVVSSHDVREASLRIATITDWSSSINPVIFTLIQLFSHNLVTNQVSPLASALQHINERRRRRASICRWPSLTRAAQSLLPQSDQHVETQVAVGRLVEVLQPPHVLPVVLHVLQENNHTHTKQIFFSLIITLLYTFLSVKLRHSLLCARQIVKFCRVPFEVIIHS